MPYYIPDLVSKTTCIGNTLSTFNISFSNLDTNLYNLSTYATNSINFLSSTMISVSSQIMTNMLNVSSSLFNSITSTSAFLQTEIEYVSSFLQTEIEYVSATVINDYIAQGWLFTPEGGGELNWDIATVGNNAKMYLTADIILNNPIGIFAGQTGNLITELSGTSGHTITGYGDKWLFSGGASAIVSTDGAKNVISYYYDGDKLLANIITF